ncbi:unnamed protein product [Natator depressus]
MEQRCFLLLICRLHTTRLCCMKIAETSQHLLHEGLFRFKHVPYDLASAPSAFQKMMSFILKNQHGVQRYLDDIIVFRNTSEEHDNNLQSVLNCISKAGLKLNSPNANLDKLNSPFWGIQFHRLD